MNITFNDFQHMCRTCMFTSGLNPILDNNIIDILHRLTGIQYSTTDGMPQQICLKCYQKINEIQSFTLQCKQTHLNLSKCLLTIKNNSNKLLNNEIMNTDNVTTPNNKIEFVDIKQEVMDDTDVEKISEQIDIKEELMDVKDETNKTISESNVLIKKENRSYFDKEIHNLDTCLTNEDSNNQVSFNSNRKEKFSELSGNLSLNESSNSNFMELGKETEFNLNRDLINLDAPLNELKSHWTPLTLKKVDSDTSSDSSLQCTLPSVMKEAQSSSLKLLPKKSQHKYEVSYNQFMSWRKNKNISSSFSEKVLMSYFGELIDKVKPNTLWTQYSMLRSTLLINQDVDITNYLKLKTLLKCNSHGYHPKKSKTLTSQEVNQFLHEAPDHKYLFSKVALVIGITGSCRKGELYQMKIDDIKDLGSAVLIKINDTKTKKPREFTITGEFYSIYKKYAMLRPANINERRFFLNYQNQKCTRQPVGINKFGNIPKQIATYLHLKNPELYTGHCFRRSSTITLIQAVNGSSSDLPMDTDPLQL